MAHKQVQSSPAEELPVGTQLAQNETAEHPNMTFAMPLVASATRLDSWNGWTAVLRFLARESVDLVGIEIDWFDRPLPPASDDEVYFAVRQWVQAKADRPFPEHAPPGGVSLRQLNGVRIADYQTRARQFLGRASLAAGGQWLGADWSQDAGRRTGRRGTPDLHFAQLAATYVHLVSKGDDPAPIETIAAEQHIAATTVRNKIVEARRRGLLTPTRPGVAGGELTEKAIKLLEGEKS